MTPSTPTIGDQQIAQLLIDLEAQQDDLLRDLDELNSRIEQAIVLGQLDVHRSPQREQGN